MLAVIDIGTNTINLLIAAKEGAGFKTQHFERIPARLGKGGMKDGVLTEEAMLRGLDALAKHMEMCALYEVKTIKVTATSAVRSASNGEDFVQRVKANLNLEIEVIDGDREAELIWKGVSLTGLLNQERGLIMDIGGGSTEFILADSNQVFWKKSYDLGVTRIAERFQAPDPFNRESEMAMKTELITDLSDLWSTIETYPVQRLIGASGSFNSISAMLAKGRMDSLDPVQQAIPMVALLALSEEIRRKTSEERFLIPGLVPDRVDTIAYSMLLIDLVLEKSSLDEVFRSSYALKEGLMREMLT